MQRNKAILVDIRLKTFTSHHTSYVIITFFNLFSLEINEHLLLIPIEVVEKEVTVVSAGQEKKYRITIQLNPESKSKGSKSIIMKSELTNKLLEKFKEMSKYVK